MNGVATTIAWFALFMTAYYGLLLALGLAPFRTARHTPGVDLADVPLTVVVVPARDEAIVIGSTVTRALELDGEPLVLVMDDGSSDGTAEVARAAAVAAGCEDRLLVVTRGSDIAGTGKGAVLNHAAVLVSSLVADGDERLGGRAAHDVCVCVLDADGWLQHDALEHVSALLRDPRVAGVQLPVRMWNARAGFLARMQDLEFVAYGFLFQLGRDRIGTVLMGGNGQFVRLSALQELGETPWSDCLTEDLDIGLRLLELGWHHRFCPDAWVAQQAVASPRRFVRQRTRWVQGHLTCWAHLPTLWRPSTPLSLRARIDLTLHLLLGAFGLVAAVQVAAVLAAAVSPAIGASILPSAPGPVGALILVTLTTAPIAMVGHVYQRHAHAPLAREHVLGVLLVYGLYHYLWSTPATVTALLRIATSRDGWSKTARDDISNHDLAAEAALQGGTP